MARDLDQRVELEDYQVRDLKAIQRHVALVLLSYFVLILFQIFQWLMVKRKNYFSPSLRATAGLPGTKEYLV